MGGTIFAAVPVNSEAGSYLTFAFPILLFCAIAGALYLLLFARPHARVPGRPVAPAADAGPPSPEAAHAAAVAGGLPIAEGGGSAESGTEPAGAVAAAAAADDAVAEAEVTAVSGTDQTGLEDAGPGDGGPPEPGPDPEEGGA